jgi:hypothetical protein
MNVINLLLHLGEGRGEGATLTTAGFSLSHKERVGVRVRLLPNVAEILEA